MKCCETPKLDENGVCWNCDPEALASAGLYKTERAARRARKEGEFTCYDKKDGLWRNVRMEWDK